MTFAYASAFRVPWGRYTNRRLDDIAATDLGLRYLDWLISVVDGPFRLAPMTYLSEPEVTVRLDEAMDRLVGKGDPC